MSDLITHVSLVLDASSSMRGRTKDVVTVVDGLVKELAARSTNDDHETRVTIYTFASKAECKVFDKDVLRLPSISNVYSPCGNTALIDAVILSQKDLAETAQMYGDHAFLTYVITDGEENYSRATADDLKSVLQGQPEEWTIGILVPNINGIHLAKRYGFPAGNIAIWDVNSKTGVAEVGQVISSSVDNYMTSRTAGVRGSKSGIFSVDPSVLNKTTVAATGMKPLDPSSYVIIPVHLEKVCIAEFVRTSGLVFRVGQCYYQLTKKETIQANKKIAVVEKDTAKVYIGDEARQLLGLPDMEVRVQPDSVNPKFDVYIQSTSNNRNLFAGTNLLYVK